MCPRARRRFKSALAGRGCAAAFAWQQKRNTLAECAATPAKECCVGMVSLRNMGSHRADATLSMTN